MNSFLLITKKDIVIFTIVVLFTSRLAVWLGGYTGHVMFPSNQGEGYWNISEHIQTINWMARWDSGWYNGIIWNGYTYHEGKQSTVAFFPLYPYTVKFINYIFGNIVISSIVLNHILFGFSIYIFINLMVSKGLDKSNIVNSTWLLATFPGSIFFSLHYSESLYLFLVLSVFYFCEKSKIKTAIMFAILASATRVTGVITWGIVGLYWLKECGWEPKKLLNFNNYKFVINNIINDYKRFILVMLCPLGLAAFMLFQYFKFGDPLLFIKVQESWGREQIGPLYVLIKNISAIFEAICCSDNLNSNTLKRTYELIFTLFALFASIKVWTKYGPQYSLFVILSLFLAISSSIDSTIRYVSVLFPIFMYLGSIIPSVLGMPLCILFASVLGIFAALFANWFFIG